jgi:hypothetical protein
VRRARPARRPPLARGRRRGPARPGRSRPAGGRGGAGPRRPGPPRPGRRQTTRVSPVRGPSTVPGQASAGRGQRPTKPMPRLRRRPRTPGTGAYRLSCTRAPPTGCWPCARPPPTARPSTSSCG